ncbi:MAG TPA: TetR/AcrR family transcriptional regulator [Yinghuangia sp.]|uniref:TetR/AcrR family transcriptional regulator n=1 Tax=Yinghuangia sp. YIM S10712 TaxID=3436930 RepID=UPI002B8593E3|nr:TetR/AcrR family transcriptional regulator [Yinghuangia sp.]
MSPRPAATTPGRFQPPDVRRRQILTAVAELLLENGYDPLTVSRVAERAGVAKGTVYLYFDSKHALISALQAEMWERMLADPARLMDDPSLTWAGRLDGLVAAWIHDEVRHKELHHVLFHELGGGFEPMSEARELLTAMLRGGAEAGEFAIDDVELTADFLLHAYLGPCHHAPNTEESETKVAAGVQALFRRVVGASLD